MRTRVLHVVPDLIPYGLENIVAYLAREIDRGRFEPAVVSLYDASLGGLEDQLGRHGIKVFHLGKRRGLDWRMIARFSKVLSEFRPRIVHTHNYVLRYTYAPALWHRIPVQVHTVHNVAQKEVDRVGRALQRVAFRGGVVPVAIAQEVADTIRRVYGVAEGALIPNGIPVRDYRACPRRREQWREREGFGGGDLLCLCVGRLAAQKDHATLLRAFASGAAGNPRARLLLAGEGPLRSEIEKQIATLGLEGRVSLLGRRSDIPEILSAVDLFVLASRWEGNPLSVMEAMSAGLPVIATSVGGVPELVRDGISGLLVPPGEPKLLAAAIGRLLDDADARASMGRIAARLAEENFDVRVMARAYERLYERLARGPALAAAGTLAGARKEMQL
ncbi:MAG: glycosyltransferase [Acidobacteriota bacterium]|nr:glycosyltransferase [Acidobacteriota bacterium]